MAENFRRSSGGEDEQSSGAPEWLENYFDADDDGDIDSSTGAKKKKRFRKHFKPLFRALFPRSEKQDDGAKDADRKSILDILSLDKEDTLKESHIADPDAEQNRVTAFATYQETEDTLPRDSNADEYSAEQPFEEVQTSTTNEIFDATLSTEEGLNDREDIVQESSPGTGGLTNEQTEDHQNQAERQDVAYVEYHSSIPNVTDEIVVDNTRHEQPKDMSKPIKGPLGVAGFVAAEMLSRRRDNKLHKDIQKQQKQLEESQVKNINDQRRVDVSLKRLIRRTRKTKRNLNELNINSQEAVKVENKQNKAIESIQKKQQQEQKVPIAVKEIIRQKQEKSIPKNLQPKIIERMQAPKEVLRSREKTQAPEKQPEAVIEKNIKKEVEETVSQGEQRITNHELLRSSYFEEDMQRLQKSSTSQSRRMQQIEHEVNSTGHMPNEVKKSSSFFHSDPHYTPASPTAFTIVVGIIIAVVLIFAIFL